MSLDQRSNSLHAFYRSATMSKTRILLAEDDEELSLLVSDYLQWHGFEVMVVSRGDEVTEAAQSNQPDLIILDWMLPGRDGLQLCRDLKTWFSGPIMLLTSRTGWVDEIVGLEVGADEYLGKPVEPRLLLARIQLLLRRMSPVQGTAQPAPQKQTLEINTANREAKLTGRALELTDAEYDLLVYLRARTGQILTRTQLSEEVFSQVYDGIGRSVDVRVGRLRAKLGDDAKNPRWIKSVRGVGYLFVEPT
jgi:DNA-binding response OmpR family regulator